MLTVFALLPLCHIIVATDLPYRQAVLAHEFEHCWGMPAKHAHGKLAPGWRAHGAYPASRSDIYFDTSKNVRRLCGDPAGCQWFDK